MNAKKAKFLKQIILNEIFFQVQIHKFYFIYVSHLIQSYDVCHPPSPPLSPPSFNPASVSCWQNFNIAFYLTQLLAYKICKILPDF